MNAGSVPCARQATARIWSSSRFPRRTSQLRAWLIVCGGGAIMFRMTSSGVGFVAGAKNLFSIYMDAVDAWTIYDNADVMSPRLVASRAVGGSTVIADDAAWKALKELQS